MSATIQEMRNVFAFILLIGVVYIVLGIKHVGRFIEFNALTSYSKVKLAMNIPVDAPWQRQSSFVLDYIKNHPTIYDSFDKFVVDFGAHDGISFSSTIFFIQQGYGAFMLEPNPSTFKKLMENVGSFDTVTCANAEVGFDPEFGVIGDRTTNKVLRKNKSKEVQIWPVDLLLGEYGVPSRFMLLSIHNEFGQNHNLKLLKRVMKTHVAAFIIMENSPPNYLMKELGYLYLAKIKFDTIFVYVN